ncbi:MAG: hypothetical protein L0216_00400, partial [Planctomycetales bacterium]|nr:hypothetical protein [Planctomycetales bacterium]
VAEIRPDGELLLDVAPAGWVRPGMRFRIEGAGDGAPRAVLEAREIGPERVRATLVPGTCEGPIAPGDPVLNPLASAGDPPRLRLSRSLPAAEAAAVSALAASAGGRASTNEASPTARVVPAPALAEEPGGPLATPEEVRLYLGG